MTRFFVSGNHVPKQSFSEYPYTKIREFNEAWAEAARAIATDPAFIALFNMFSKWTENMTKPSELEQLLLLEIEAAELPAPECQYKFHGSRKWKADFAWPCYRVIAEVNGGTYQHMGHSTGGGIHRDYEKGNAAQLMGYIYLEFDKQMIEDGSAIKTIQQAIEGRQ